MPDHPTSDRRHLDGATVLQRISYARGPVSALGCWPHVETFDFGGSTSFYGIWGSGPRDVYLAGQRNTTNGPVYLMMHGHD